MFRGNMIRWACAVATTVMAVSGCDCPGPNPPVNCTDTTITFETPAADQTVDAPFDVSVIVKNADGSAFNFERAQLSVSGGEAIDASSVSGNRATFTAVPGAPGAQALVATISQGTCSKSSAPHNITVRDACSNAQVTAVSFPQDTGAPLGVLNRSELPSGTDLQVQVDATCVSGVQVRIKRNGTEVAPLTAFSNGRATISLSGIPATDSEVVDVFAELVRGTTVLNSATGAAVQSIRIARALPACAVTTSGTFGPLADADATTPGFQMRVTGTMAAGTTGTLTVTGANAVPVVPNGSGDVSADFTLTTSGNYTATLVCSDNTGNTNTVTGLFTLDFDPPVVAITAPACGAQLTTFNVIATADVTGADGQMLTFFSRPSNMPMATPVAVGSAVVTMGVASGMISLPGNGSYILIAEVTDAVGNVGRDTEGDANCNGGGPGPIVVNSTQCSLSFTRPQASPAVVLRSEVVGGNYGLSLTSSCANTPVELTTNGANPVTVSTDGMGVVGFNVPATDGSTFSYRACITNTGGNPPTCTTVSVTYRLSQPTILTPNAGVMPLNQSRDSSETTPGVQAQLAFTSPAGLATFICSNQTPRPSNVADCPNGASGFWVMAGGSSFSSPVPGFTFPDGTYDVVIVSQGAGGSFDTSAPLTVVADSIAPCVAVGLVISGDTNMDSALNATELAGAVSAQFSLGCGDTPATISAVRWTSGCGSVVHNQPSGVSNAGNSYTVALQRSTLPTPVEQQFAFGIQLTDIHGNTNTLCGTSPAPNAAALFTLRVDDTVPVCTIAAPSAAAVFGLAGDADMAAADYQLRVAFDTSPDVATTAGVVTLTGAAPIEGMASRNGDRITRNYTFPATGTDTVSVGVVCTDGAGNATTATTVAGVVVDRDAPTCTLVNPANNSTSSTFSVTTRVDVTGGEGRMVTVRSGTTDVGTLTVSGGQAAGSLSYPSGLQSVTATLTDAAGNSCTTPPNTLTVNATGCAIAVVSPTAIITTANSTPVSPGVASIAPAARSSNCTTGQTVRLYRLLPGPRTLLGTATTNGSGDVAFTTNVNDATTVQYEFEIDNGAGLLTTVSTSSLLVDLTLPTAASTSPALPALFVVSNSNSNVPTDPRYFVDTAAGVPADLTFTLTTVAGAAGGTARVRLTTPSQVVGSVAVAGSPPTLAVAAAFPHKLSGVEYVVELVDANGNVAELHRGLVSTDVIAPASPGISTSFAVPSDARVGSVQVRIESPTVTPSYDDGTTQTSGAHAGYDIRWTTLRQWNDTLGPRAGAPCLELNADYFDSSKVVTEALVPFNAGAAINQPIRVPPANRYCIEVRARDALGNYSPHVLPTVMNNDAREHELTNPTGVASQDFGLVMAAGGSLNNDTVDDLVVAGSRRTITSTNVGAVYVYYGSSGFNAQATCTMPACQEIQPYDTAAGGRFGASLAVGDVGGDSAKPDLVVGSPFWSTSTGRVFLFFGSAAQASIDTATFIEFRGAQNNTRLGEMVGVIPGRAGQTLLVISAHTEPFAGTTASNQGRVYIYRSRTLAEWQALRTGSFVPVSPATADWVIDGPLPVSTQSPSPSAGNQFARARGGFTGLGDMNGDSIPDLAISMAKNTTDGNKVFLYAGREAQDAGTTVTSATSTLSTLTSTVMDMSEVGFVTGFGTRLVGGAIYGSATAPDLLVTKQDIGAAYLYRDGAGGMFGAPDITIQGIESQSFGSWGSIGDLNNDTRVDLAIGEAAGTNGSTWVFFQYGNNRFDSTTGNGFWLARLQGTSGKGVCNAVGDFDGDLVQDLAMGDSTGSFGRVFVWH